MKKTTNSIPSGTFTQDISWAQFEICNSNKREAFEQLCRWLFNEFFFDGKELLQSNPNNPGVEVTPVFHSASNKRISFQAKYFDSIDYEQIKESVKTAVKYYAGKLDVIYLYCNKDVTVTSKAYQSVLDVLKPAGIDLVPITNQEILNQIMKNETMCWHFFDQVMLSNQWFRERLDISLSSLGPRYNDEFNVPTQTEELFNYFLCNTDAVNRINHNKNELLASLVNDRYKYLCCSGALYEIINAIESLEDISIENILDCLTWSDTLSCSCSSAFSVIDAIAKKKKDELANIDRDDSLDKRIAIAEDIAALDYLLRIPQLIAPEGYEQTLMQNQTLVIKGNAGSGKSQLLAVAAEKLVQAERGVLLLLGTNYINDHILCTQTSEIIGTNVPLDAFLHKLEAIAVQNNAYSYLFVDAINESTYKKVWKTGVQSLLAKLSQYPHIKLVISVRTGYEKLVFDDATVESISAGTLACLVHTGFREESIEATLTFLNHYGIPFLPSYFLQSEMTNPLFLTLFCKTYTGENFDFFSLFKKLIENADREAQAAAGISDPMSLLDALIDEMSEYRLKTNSLTIAQADLFDFTFWNRYGLADKKIPYIAALEKTGLLIGTAYDEEETYYLGYNLLEDFVCARTIIKKHKETDAFISYLLNNLLKVEDGLINNHHNIDIFIIACGLYAEKNRKECFDDIARNVTNEIDRDDIVNRYLESFIWRTANSVDAVAFSDFLSRHPVDREIAFRMLIENSAKEHHPLNSFFLHDLLFKKKLAERDALWTDYINHLASDDIRVFQLVTYFDSGKKLNGLSQSNTELLLILLVWLLTSSNRFLRDKASKAAIELLKHEFALCKPLLQRFEGVNDPYVVQRLYGIILGACVKRSQEHKAVFRELAAYVYSSIFDQEFVYPDILLRDYARLILERWRYEYPTDSEFIEPSKITPPYKSVPIPVVEQQEYYRQENGNSGFDSIDFSMRINHADCPGMYGDFGRYTFQSALSIFEDVDVLNLYHYAMQFIRDELGYDEQLGAQDAMSSYYRYSRHDTKKIERIGKKYQWISFYNILARISDRHRIKQWEEPSRVYEGPWEPYVRDFDPTLNRNFMFSPNIPTFDETQKDLDFLPEKPAPKSEEILHWIEVKPGYFTSIPERLLTKDINGNDWVVLHLHDDNDSKSLELDDHSLGIAKGTQKVWLIAEAFFVKPCHFDAIVQHIKSKQFMSDSFPEASNVYQLFNREYAWSPGYNSVFTSDWIGYEIETGKYRIETEIIEMPDLDQLLVDSDDEITIPMVKRKIERKIPEAVIDVELLPAASRVLWEEQYDASQEESTSFYIPCGSIIKNLQLVQKESDGYYYSKDGTLVCFDSSLCGQSTGLIIRADYLNKYLHDHNIRLIWTCIGEKQYFLGDHNQKWSTWKGCFTYENDKVQGDFERYERGN